MNAAMIARRLGGRSIHGGGYLCRCPVPSHGAGRGDRRPSLSVADGMRAIIFHCFAGCDGRDVVDAVRGLGLIDRTRPAAFEPPRTAPAQEPRPDPLALKLWRSGVPVQGTLAETYLVEHRGLAPPFPPSLRFVPSLRYPPSGLDLPALLAAVQAPTREIIAVQSTYLRPSDGAKAPVSSPRLTTGALGTGAVRLAPASAILGLAEGTEDALSAMHHTGCPCWASLGAQRMAKVAIPAEVTELHLFADDDAVGRKAAEATFRAHRALGRTAIIHLPPPGRPDWGDLSRTASSEMAA